MREIVIFTKTPTQKPQPQPKILKTIRTYKEFSSGAERHWQGNGKKSYKSQDLGVDPRKINVFLKDFASPRVTAAAVDGESIKTYTEFSSGAKRPWRGSGEKSNHKLGVWGRSPKNTCFLKDFTAPRVTAAAVDGESIKTYMEFASRANRPWRGSGEKSNHKAGCWGRSPQNIKFLLDFALPQATPAAAYGQSIRT